MGRRALGVLGQHDAHLWYDQLLKQSGVPE